MYCTCLQGAQTEKPLYGSCSEPINLSVLLFSLTYQTWVACPQVPSTSPPPPPSTSHEARGSDIIPFLGACVTLTQNSTAQKLCTWAQVKTEVYLYPAVPPPFLNSLILFLQNILL